MKGVPDASVHLVVTSPPYWTLKEYEHADGQLGAVADYVLSRLATRSTCSIGNSIEGRRHDKYHGCLPPV